MKKPIVFVLALFSIVGFADAAKKRKVVKSAAPQATSSNSTVKLDADKNKKRARSEAFEAWLKEMKKRIQRSNTKANKLVAVAAVRGDETPDAPPLYWKGKKAEGAVASGELVDFDAAVETALNGDPLAAKEKLQSFLLAYPKSSMAPDAKETLSRLEASDVNP